MPDIGSTLREARMRARIDISEVEAHTKIRAKYLRAIENEEWNLLPGSVYIKSFLRTYGDYLGLDSRLLVDEWRRLYERPDDHEVPPVASPGRERERPSRGIAGRGLAGPLVPPWAIIAVVLVAVVAVLYAIGSSSGGGPKPNPTSAGTGAHRHPRGHGHAHSVTQSNATTAVHPATPTKVRLQLVPTGTVYVCVEDRTGRKLIPGVIYTVGQTIPSVSAGQLFVTLGNAGVRMTVNGKSHPVAPSATAIGLKVTPTAISPLAPGHAPTCA